MLIVGIILSILAIVIAILLVPPTQARKSIIEWMKNIMKIRLRSPITLINSETEHITKTKQTKEKLNQEQILERQTIIRQVQAVSERLFKNSQGADSRAITSIFREIIKESPVSESMSKNNMVSQCIRLMNNELNDLFNEVGKFHRSTEELTVSGLDDSTLNSIFNTTRNLILNYRRIVDEVRECFNSFASVGIEPLWKKAPWSIRIHRELADNYDELMRLVTDLNSMAPKRMRDLLPHDDQLSKFPRASLWS